MKQFFEEFLRPLQPKTLIHNRMKTNNEKWQGNPNKKTNSSAGRDGKIFEKRDVKSILKGTRGAAKFGQPQRNNDESHSGYTAENKPLENRVNSEKRSFELKENRSWSENKRSYDSSQRSGSYGESKPYRNEDRKPRFNSNGERIQGRPRIKVNNRDSSERLTLRKPGEIGQDNYVETRFDSKRDGVVFRKPRNNRQQPYDPNAKYSHKKQNEYRRNNIDPTKPVRLNKFLANAGICSRREADEYIQAGVISVNGEIITEMGVKILPTDKVMFHDQTVRSERKVYILLNKPKDCVTTAEDTHERLTVLDLVKNACSERIYPVGRLDRNTTGVLLLTNDGDLASKLTHPKYDKKKIYHVTLDKPLKADDFQTIMSGVQLDDETIAADALEFVKDDEMKQVGIEIHSGQNRVVRRIFEKLGYKVIRLDRVYFAGLTKKNLPRGKYRFLSEREINMLKMGAHE